MNLQTIALSLMLYTSAFAMEWIPSKAPCPPDMFARTVPMTGSMRPALHGGETVYCETYVGQPIKVGDIIALDTQSSGPRLHRVTAINKKTVWTAGDACRHSDGPSSIKSIMYIARFALRKTAS